MTKKIPMLFSAPLVRALLDGCKTQTRRVMKVQPDQSVSRLIVDEYHPTKVGRDGIEYPGAPIWGAYSDDGEFGLKAPCAPGDLIWVRETWRGIVQINSPWARYDEGVACYIPDRDVCKGVEYKASHVANDEPWRPSIHMPRWASRLTLRVTDVRAQRLQDISEEDAIREGCGQYTSQTKIHRSFNPDWLGVYSRGFQALWDDIYSPNHWDANPWVWAISFDVIRKNVDEVAA